MDRVKQFFKYVIWIIVFFIFSNILIKIGLNTTYHKITQRGIKIDSVVEITDAQATNVNGKISGKIKNSVDDNLNGKYIKLEFYTDNNTLAGTKYIAVNGLGENAEEDFEFYFSMQHIDSYKVSISDTADLSDEEFFSYEQYKRYKIIYWAVLLMLM